MEPERKIEKLLRAYAKKRGADAGNFKMSPAARRLLQSEIARNADKPEEESLSLWQLLRQQWAFLTAFTLIIFFCASLFLPALSSAKKKAQSTGAVNRLRQIGLAAQMAAADNNGRLPKLLDALTNQLGSKNILIDPQSGRPFVFAAGGENLDELQTNAVLAYSPEVKDQGRRAVLFADDRVEMVNRRQFAELTKDKPSQLAANDLSELHADGVTVAAGFSHTLTVTPPPVPSAIHVGDIQLSDKTESDSEMKLSPASSPPPPVAAPVESERLLTQESFYRNAIGRTNFVQVFGGTMEKSISQTPVILQNFQVQQKGDALRVVDSDGSVYAGSLLTENANQNAASSPDGSVPGGTFQLPTFSFRVTGTSRTLRQNVVFTGNVTAISNAPARQQNLANAAAAQQQLSLKDSCITGTAVIGRTNQIEINARPTTP